MIEVVTIHVDGSIEIESIEQGCTALQKRVGGYIEAVIAPLLDDEVTLWINEEGKLLSLPINVVATELWHLLSPEMRGVDFLCGTVVVSGGYDDEGWTLSIPEKLKRVLEDTANK